MKELSKKTGVLILLIVMLFSIAACSSPAKPQEVENEESASTDDTETSGNEQQTSADDEADVSGETSSLVIYFSRSGEQYAVGVIEKGNTAIVAEMIAEETGADLFEIVPANDNYPTVHDEMIEVAKQEQSEKARPEYAGELPDLSKYDTIFIGSPVWWGDWPMIMYTVFENNDFTGKTLIPFSTHEGSGLAGFDQKLASACPDSTVLEGLAVRGTEAQNNQDSVRVAVKDWLSGLDSY